jgi:gluconolactonase
MTSQRHSPVENRDILSRRSLIKAMGVGALAAGSGSALAQTPAQPPAR